MSIYSIPTIIATVLITLLGLFVLSKNSKSKVNITFATFTLSISIWLTCYSMAYNFKLYLLALNWFRIGYIGVIFIPITWYHFTCVFLRKDKKKIIYNSIFVGYILALLFSIPTISSNHFVTDLYEYFWGYYPKVSRLWHPLFLAYFNIFFTISILMLFFGFWHRKDKIPIIQKSRIRYLFLACLVGTIAAVDFIPNYGLELYPFGFISMISFVFIVTYSIIKYRLMDISVVITRTGIFVAIYSLVLGVPFVVAYTLQPHLIALFGDKWWLVPLVSSTVLATVGPFVFIYINKKAEDRLLKEQRQYQSTLRQASSGMIRIRDLNKLLNLIVRVVTRTVKIEFASIFLLNEENNQYIIAAKQVSSALPQSETFLQGDSTLIKWLNLKKEPLVYEEIQLQSQDNPSDIEMLELEQQLRQLPAAVVIPSFVGRKLLGFLVLGKKLSGKIYSQDDLNVFSVLTNQAALAIENAQFYEDIKEAQQQLFQAEKMATVGTMADGLSHQINNRFQALSLIAGDSLDVLGTTDISNCSPEVKDSYNQLKHAFERIQANVMQGGEIVRGLLKYSRPGQSGFEPVDFTQILDGALEMAQYKVRLSELDIQRDVPRDLPKIKCNLTQLEEVFFNLIDNAYDATKERRTTNKEEGYKGKITISAAVENGLVRIVFTDNGIGVKDKDKEKLFTPFFTTKSSTRKGTGLGLYVIQKIISSHEGTISIDSTYNAGTKFEIVLPAAK